MGCPDSRCTVIRENCPLVLALFQVVPDERVNQLIGKMLEDVLGDEQVGRRELLSDIAHLKRDLAFLVAPPRHSRFQRVEKLPVIAAVNARRPGLTG